MPEIPLRIARGLTLYGKQLEDESIDRPTFLKRVDVKDGSYWNWMRQLGADDSGSGPRFFDNACGTLRFGPGAGMVLGVSLGTTSLRAALFDANGSTLHEYKMPPRRRQLSLAPEKLLDRIRDAATNVMEPALADESLRVEGKLRFRGVAVAWPAPINRDKQPVGEVLSHRSWRNNTGLNVLVARHLKLENEFSHTINDAWAAAIAVAFDRTREVREVEESYPEMTAVIRLAGGIGAATIVIEPAEEEGKERRKVASGFAHSILLGGKDAHAGELGHVTVCPATIAELNKKRPKGLGRLEPYRCSCTPEKAKAPRHLEAFASRAALVNRVSPGGSEEKVIQKIFAEPYDPLHRRALEDVGILTADCLLGSVQLLNPAQITLTGSLANPVVKEAFDNRLYDERRFLSHPHVSALEGGHNEFICARGAALAVLRAQVHRRLNELVGREAKVIPRQLEANCMDLSRLPWVS